MPELTPEFVEHEYNNRALVPDHASFFARWEKDSAYVRNSLECEIDVAYGADARHRIDLFPARHARGTLVFIHGGYWRSLDKSMFSWLAAPYVAAGIGVAMPNYRLAPNVRIDSIIDDAVAALNWLMLGGVKHRLTTDRVVVSGHSAGGHLTAAIFATAWSKLSFDPARIAGGVPISGIVDFAPIERFSFNSDFQLDPVAVKRLDLYTRKPTLEAPLVVAVGGSESSEFVRQSQLLADAWRKQVKSLLVLPGYNHFSVVDAFAERGQPLHDATLGLF
ncbi:MAG TPA: alpha/beta hydrolase [Usitatibacter sp.]|nr:alpha/beta hydrolase [Usitatibacter sp.]